MQTVTYKPSSQTSRIHQKCGQLSVADEVALEMGFPDLIVKIARAYHKQKHGTDFENAMQLYLVAEELINNPQKQYEIAKMMDATEVEEDKKKHGFQDVQAKHMLKEKTAIDAFAKEALKEKIGALVQSKTDVTDVSSEMQKSSAAEVQSKDTTHLRKKVEKLARENHRLRQRKVCCKCKEVELASSGVTFLPCGHFITCEVCSEACDQCPACGKTIMGTVRTYLS